MIERSRITGLILAGGRGSRMGGLDKGLQTHDGVPLALHALRRLAPQVGAVAINANRHVDAYAAMGAPVWPDEVAEDYPGPLAGFLAGIEHCRTPWLATVPCDSPWFPEDLVARLAVALDADPSLAIAMAATPEGDELVAQPVFCLMRVAGLGESLRRFVESGQRKVGHWAAQQRMQRVRFDVVEAFANANSPEELAQMQAGARVAPKP